ncbi:MAG: methylmalonyl Co-A mutase-associated GTPase MeaB [Acidimicrobiia bacterium]
MTRNRGFDQDRFAAGDRRVLGRAISAVENDGPEAQTVLAAVYGRTGHAHVVGVTGPPGAGKSTLVNELIGEYRRAELSVAVVAVDPSSPFGGGAILGDRIRMSDHALDDEVFVRSVASRGQLGGLSRATARVVDVLDGFGFDAVIVETVGAGQAEINVMHLAQTVIFVAAPGFGDETQAVKAGILEIADIYVLNKADHPMAKQAERTLHEALPASAGRRWRQPIISTVAIDGTGVSELFRKVREHYAQIDPNERARAATVRAQQQLAAAVAELASTHVSQQPNFESLAEQVRSGRLSLKSAAEAAFQLVASRVERDSGGT